MFERGPSALSLSAVEQIAYGLRGGVVEIRDGARVDNEPADRRRRALHEGAHFIDRRIMRTRCTCLSGRLRSPAMCTASSTANSTATKPSAPSSLLKTCGSQPKPIA